MLGLASAIDALGDVDVQLNAAPGGYAAGEYHFNGQQALAFVRERSSSDDFSYA